MARDLVSCSSDHEERARATIEAEGVLPEERPHFLTESPTQLDTRKSEGIK